MTANLQAPAIDTAGRVSKRLTYAYVAGLGAIATVALITHVVLQSTIHLQASDAAVISVSERQRVLTQRAALFSLSLLTAQDDAVRERFRISLIEIANLIERSHHGLTQGNATLNLPGAMSEQVSRIYNDPPYLLNQRINQFTRALRTIADTPDLALSAENEVLGYIGSESTGLLEDLERLVAQLRRESELRTVKLQRMETSLLVLTLALLLATALFIFRPMERRIRRELLQRAAAEARTRDYARRLAHYAKELKRSNTELEEFASVVSHDLQEPLQVVLSGIELVSRRVRSHPNAEELQRLLNGTKSGILRMRTLIRDLLQLSRISGKLRGGR